ncbi:MAG: hypothetical protein ACM3SQ_19610 [Betaproteobacteria bacterium]
MRLVRFGIALGMALALVASVGARAAAQAAVTSSDIQRLQDEIYDASNDIMQLRSHDASVASSLQSQLDDLRDEVTYLKVKLRKNEPVARTEYSDLRDRIENVRQRARGEAGQPAAARPPSATLPPAANSGARPAPGGTSRAAGTADVPVGTEFDVRLQDALSSATAQVEDRFQATTMVDLKDADRVIVPAGSVMRGVVSSVDKAGRVNRKGSLTVAFDRITVRGSSYPIHATVTQALESEGIKGEAGKIGAGAGVGAIIGGILGGVKGALAGILIGGGGTIAATEGQDVDLAPGTVLRVRLDSPLDLK